MDHMLVDTGRSNKGGNDKATTSELSEDSRGARKYKRIGDWFVLVIDISR